jgi:hypothetical protein
MILVYAVRKQAQVIAAQVAETLSSITAALNIHLNIGQNTIMNTSAVFVSLETASISSLPSKLIQQVGNAEIRLPSIFNSILNSKGSVSLRVSIPPTIRLEINLDFSIVDDATTCAG